MHNVFKFFSKHWLYVLVNFQNYKTRIKLVILANIKIIYLMIKLYIILH